MPTDNSEIIFQAQITAMAGVFESNRHLGFDARVWHEGVTVLDRMPTVASPSDLAEIACHFAHCQLDVTVYNDDSQAPITDEDLAAAVHSIASSAIPDGQVWDRVRIATNDQELREFYQDHSSLDADGTPAGPYNWWFVRRVTREIERAGGIDDDIVSTVHRFDLDYFRGILEVQDEGGGLPDGGGNYRLSESGDRRITEAGDGRTVEPELL